MVPRIEEAAIARECVKFVGRWSQQVVDFVDDVCNVDIAGGRKDKLSSFLQLKNFSRIKMKSIG